MFVEGNRLEEARMTTANSIPSPDPELPDIVTPCYLLVDRNTASAAEVFTGALQVRINLNLSQLSSPLM